MSHIPPAVAKAAMDTGVARKPIVDMDAYVARLSGRLDPVAGWLRRPSRPCAATPSASCSPRARPAVIRAANTYCAQGFGQPLLVGTGDTVRERFKELGIPLRRDFDLLDTRRSPYTEEFTDFLYARLQQRGYLGATASGSSPTSATCSPR